MANNGKGRRHVLATDPNEPRSFLWRYKGKLHNDVITHCQKKGISINRYLTKLVEKDVYSIPEPPPKPAPTSISKDIL